MLDLKFILKNMNAVKDNCKNRNVKIDFSEFEKLAEKRAATLKEVEELRKQQNDIAKQMKQPLDKSEREKLIEQGAKLKSLVTEKEAASKSAEESLKEIQEAIPNMTHPDAPIGKGEESNFVLKHVGIPRKFDFTPKDHVELGKELGILDFEGGAKVSGQKFYFLKRDGVLLEQALINYALKTLIKEGFTPYVTPDLAKNSIFYGTGFNPRGEEAQIYSIIDKDLSLIATAEITLAGLYSDEIIPEKELPILLAGYSHCFRTEAGAYGKASKGLYRVHQFSKVEMFAYTKPCESENMLQRLLSIEEKIFTELEIPYRVVECSSGDLGGPAYRKYDIEAWMPAREGGSYGEVTSASNCTDYQARRLSIRYKGNEGIQAVHTLNGTAIATSRAIIAILENNQQEDGSIIIPDVLVPFMDKKTITKI